MSSSTQTSGPFDARFQHGSTHLIVGPSGSGKTFRTADYLRLKSEIIKGGNNIKNIVFFYATWQPVYAKLRTENVVTRWIQGMPTNEEFINAVQEYKRDGGSIVVIDDFMSEISKDLVEIITVSSRHNNTSTFILFQSLFPAHRLSRQISLNVKYIHIHKNPRENAQIQYLARQLSPNDYKWIVEAYHTATSQPYSCFIIDVTQESDPRLRYKSGFLPHEFPTIVWMSKKQKRHI